MADKRRGKKKGAAQPTEEDEKLTKLEKAVAHWLRKNVPVKKTKFAHSHVVEYFTAAKAIDSLLKNSPWAQEKCKGKGELVLETRDQCWDIMDVLLRKKMFHRAKKIPVAEKEKKKKSKEEAEEEKEPEKKGKKEKKEEKKKEEEEEKKEDAEDGSKQETKKRKGKEDKKEKKEEKAEREKKKRKIRLEMHHEQIFVDGNDAYVWLYDPTPWYYYLAGGAIVLGIIAVCLFPLWPAEMRQGVYYLSVAAAGFLVFIIVLAILKYIIFVLLFLFTAGKLRFWIFPNLTEDVGFFESFWPIYVYTYTKPKKDKESDDEESSSEEEEEEEEGQRKNGEEAAVDGDGEGSETGRDDPGENSQGEQGSDSGGSSKEFELIDDKESSS